MDSNNDFSSIFSQHFHNIRHARANFGVHPATFLHLWFNTLSRVKLDWTFHPYHLLWTLYYLKNYPTLDTAAERWNVDRDTYGKWVWRVLSMLYLHLDEVIIIISREQYTILYTSLLYIYISLALYYCSI